MSTRQQRACFARPAAPTARWLPETRFPAIAWRAQYLGSALHRAQLRPLALGLERRAPRQTRARVLARSLLTVGSMQKSHANPVAVLHPRTSRTLAAGLARPRSCCLRTAAATPLECDAARLPTIAFVPRPSDGSRLPWRRLDHDDGRRPAIAVPRTQSSAGGRPGRVQRRRRERPPFRGGWRGRSGSWRTAGWTCRRSRRGSCSRPGSLAITADAHDSTAIQRTGVTVGRRAGGFTCPQGGTVGTGRCPGTG